jgi:hypothetical protein
MARKELGCAKKFWEDLLDMQLIYNPVYFLLE